MLDMCSVSAVSQLLYFSQMSQDCSLLSLGVGGLVIHRLIQLWGRLTSEFSISESCHLELRELVKQQRALQEESDRARWWRAVALSLLAITALSSLAFVLLCCALGGCGSAFASNCLRRRQKVLTPTTEQGYPAQEELVVSRGRRAARRVASGKLGEGILSIVDAD